MDKVIIFGVNLFSSVVYDVIKREQQAQVVAFCIDKKYKKEDIYEGLPLVAFEDIPNLYNVNEIKIAITIGYSKMNKNREIVFNKCKESGFDIYTLLSNNALIYTDIIGEGSIILPGAHIGPFVEIGKSVIIWNNASISHHSIVGNFCHIAGGTIVGGGTNIGYGCFIGINSTIKNDITIGAKSFISATSYIAENTEEGKSYSGNPAKKIQNYSSDLMIRFVK